jgi:uncharacterized membrane protein
MLFFFRNSHLKRRNIQSEKSLKIQICKGIIRNHKSEDRQHNGQKKKDKQRSKNHYTES